MSTRTRALPWRLAAVGAAALTAVAAMAATASAATLFTDDFSDGNANGWSTSGGSWSVVTDGSPALRQGKTGAGLSRSFAGDSGWSDYTVQARVKALGYDTTAGFAGLVARSPGSTSFDRLVLLAGGRAELQEVRSGTVTVLGGLALNTAAGAWHTLRIEVSGSTVRGLVDGLPVATGTTRSTRGRIGVQTSQATAVFDDVVVGTAGATPTPTVTSPGSSPQPSPSVTASPTPSASPTVSPPPSNPPVGSTLVVATTGNDANPGTLAQPLRSIQRAVDLAQPGTTISVRGGTYALTTNIQILKSGQAGKPITLTAHGNEVVTVDGENLPASHTPVGGSVARPDRGAIHMEASYWKIVGLRLTRGPYGLYCSDCNNNVFERLTTVNNYESGLQIQGASSNNLVLNLDSSLNHDPRKNGESADGLAIKEGSGAGNVVRGARLWNNVDDGFDAWKFTSPITIEDSVAWGNGVNRWNFPNFAGDGNGFKMGGGGPAAGHTVRNSIAFDNAVGGFIDNGNAGSMTITGNTAWRNGGTGFDFADSTSTLTRNLSVANRTAVSLGSSTGSGNSWDLGGTWTLASTDPATITGPRTATGQIPSSNFGRPANGAAVGARI